MFCSLLYPIFFKTAFLTYSLKFTLKNLIYAWIFREPESGEQSIISIYNWMSGQIDRHTDHYRSSDDGYVIKVSEFKWSYK